LGEVGEVKLEIGADFPSLHYSLSPVLHYNMCHSDERSEEESSTNTYQPSTINHQPMTNHQHPAPNCKLFIQYLCDGIQQGYYLTRLP
jgi:hypothetical protein